MNFKEFKRFVRDRVKQELDQSSKTYTVELKKLQKTSGSYTGLLVKSTESNQGISIYLEDSYQDYRKGKTLECIVEEIVEASDRSGKAMDLDWLNDYSIVKDRLFIRVSGLSSIGSLIKSVPNRIIEDLVLTAHIRMPSTECDLCSAIVTNDLLSMMGIDAEQLFKDAFASSVKLFPVDIIPFISELRNMIPKSEHSLLDNNEDQLPKMYLVTNKARVNGAAAFFYEGVMKKLEEITGGSYYVIPSSIHEVLIFSEEEFRKGPISEERIHEINTNHVAWDEVLSDHLYFYDAETKEFHIVNTKTE